MQNRKRVRGGRGKKIEKYIGGDSWQGWQGYFKEKIAEGRQGRGKGGIPTRVCGGLRHKRAFGLVGKTFKKEKKREPLKFGDL